MTDATQLEILRDYSAGKLGRREAIARAGREDFADLLIALAQNDLDLPKPEDTPERRQCGPRRRNPPAAAAAAGRST